MGYFHLEFSTRMKAAHPLPAAICMWLMAMDAHGTRPLMADLSTNSQILTTTKHHVGSCVAVSKMDGNREGILCEGQVYLRNDPGNTAFFKFENHNSYGEIRSVYSCHTGGELFTGEITRVVIKKVWPDQIHLPHPSSPLLLRNPLNTADR
jgi:hypothetical protein